MDAKTAQHGSQDAPAQFPRAQARTSPGGESVPAELARRAVETYVRERLLITAPLDSQHVFLYQTAPCFVCLKTLDRRLRGCIGTIEAARPTLWEEIVANAIGAATRDPRFRPVTQSELDSLRYSVDVLERPEPTSFEELDPKVFGVVVESPDGARRGLLLPDIEGVETAARQVEIAARKAGILTHQPLKLYRFRVRRYKEPAPAGTV